MLKSLHSTQDWYVNNIVNTFDKQIADYIVVQACTWTLQTNTWICAKRQITKKHIG